MKLLQQFELGQPDYRNLDHALMISKNAQRESYATICNIPTPAATITHMPIPHSLAINKIASEIEHRGWHINGTAFASSYDGANAHWVFGIQYDLGAGVSMQIAGHNSHTKMSSLISYLQGETNACTNMCVPAQVALRRKHTNKILDQLDDLISFAMDDLTAEVHNHEIRLEAYIEPNLTNENAHDLVIRAMENNALPATYIPTVISEWRAPQHKEFEERNLYSLYNCFTEAFKKSRASIPQRSSALHEILDHKAGLSTSVNYIRTGE